MNLEYACWILCLPRRENPRRVSRFHISSQWNEQSWCYHQWPFEPPHLLFDISRWLLVPREGSLTLLHTWHSLSLSYFWTNGILNANKGDAYQILDEILFIVPVLLFFAQISIGNRDRSQAIIRHFLNDLMGDFVLLVLIQILRFIVFTEDRFTSIVESPIRRNRTRKKGIFTSIEPFPKHLWCRYENHLHVARWYSSSSALNWRCRLWRVSLPVCPGEFDRRSPPISAREPAMHIPSCFPLVSADRLRLLWPPRRWSAQRTRVLLSVRQTSIFDV